MDLTPDNPAGHWHGLTSPDPADQQGAASTSTTIMNMISQRFTSPRPPQSTASRSDGTGSNEVSPSASTLNLSIEGGGEPEPEPEPVQNTHTADDGSLKPPEKRTARTKTSFQMAHPPRNARHERLRIRPKLLLQLQQISRTARPVPTLDVLPSSIFTHKVGGKFPSIFRGKDRVGPNDLVVVTSESYKQPRAEKDTISFSSEDGPSGDRELVATICPYRKEEAKLKGKAEISMDQGLTWEATSLPNGSYDFVAVNGNGLQITVRWARRSKNNRKASGAPAASSSTEENKRFTFSVLDPTTRRHPVLASMTRNSIDVLDRYPTSTNADKPAGTGPSDPQAGTMGTDENLRALIVVTGIWVAFREGWSNIAMGCLQPPASPTISRPPMSPIADHDKEDQTSVPAKETPRSSFHAVRTKLRPKTHVPAPTESSLLAIPGTQPMQDNSNHQPNRLSISTAVTTDTGNSQPTTPNLSYPVPQAGNIPESSQNATNEKEDGLDPSLMKNDDSDNDNASRDNRFRSNTHPPAVKKPKEKRWRRFSSMLDSVGKKDKSGHIT